MEAFVKPTKATSTSSLKVKSTESRNHPYKSERERVREICCVPRPIGNIFTSSSTGHQVSQTGGKASTYFASRNLKLANQFRQPITPLTDTTNTTQVSQRHQIFRNCSVYINGYMGPLVSDIELKRRLARHGARVVTNFGRKSVTHVILGPNGLAGGKIQKEMLARKVGVKYVTVDWYTGCEIEC